MPTLPPSEDPNALPKVRSMPEEDLHGVANTTISVLDRHDTYAVDGENGCDTLAPTMAGSASLLPSRVSASVGGIPVRQIRAPSIFLKDFPPPDRPTPPYLATEKLCSASAMFSLLFPMLTVRFHQTNFVGSLLI